MKFTDDEPIEVIRTKFITDRIHEVESSDMSEENKRIIIAELEELLDITE